MYAYRPPVSLPLKELDKTEHKYIKDHLAPGYTTGASRHLVMQSRTINSLGVDGTLLYKVITKSLHRTTPCHSASVLSLPLPTLTLDTITEQHTKSSIVR